MFRNGCEKVGRYFQKMIKIVRKFKRELIFFYVELRFFDIIEEFEHKKKISDTFFRQIFTAYESVRIVLGASRNYHKTF